MNSDIKEDGVIGIVGGMGPEAGGVLFNSILSFSKARKDQDHLSVILMSLPKYIVDRTSFLEGREETNPALNIATIIRKLEHAGATIIGISCNTSHVPAIFNVILEQLKSVNSKVKVLNMPVETCKYIKINYPKIKRIGIMASNGTYKSNLYKNWLEHYGYEVILPNLVFQNDIIHRIIYDPLDGIKANPNKLTKKAKVWFGEAIKFFQDQGSDAIILGCTEFSAVVKKSKCPDILLIDSTESLAKSLIKQASLYKRGQNQN